jgi:hypothetical protein
MNIVYVLWTGDTPDKGVGTTDLVAFGEARQALRDAKIDFRYALIPVTPADLIPDAIAQLIKDSTK